MAGTDPIADLIDPWNPKGRNAAVPEGPPESQVWDPPGPEDYHRWAQAYSAGRINDAFRDLRVEDQRDQSNYPGIGYGGAHLVSGKNLGIGMNVSGWLPGQGLSPDLPHTRADTIKDWMNPISVEAGYRDIVPAWVSEIKQIRANEQAKEQAKVDERRKEMEEYNKRAEARRGKGSPEAGQRLYVYVSPGNK